MDKNKVLLNVEVTGLDEAMVKVTRLVELLNEVQSLLDDLALSGLNINFYESSSKESD